MNRFLLLLFIGLLCISFSHITIAQKEIPKLWGHRVHDEAHVLSQSTLDNLEQTLKAFEDSTTNQIAILTIPSLDGEILEQYAIRVAHTEWKLGQKDKDNGVLLLVVVDDRKVHIEVGQGLEGVLTDALSNRIIRNEIAPNFRRGDYDAGVIAAADAIMKAIKGEYKADRRSSSPIGGGGRFIFLLIIFILFSLFRYLSRKGGGNSSWSSGGGWFIGGGGGLGGGGGGFSGGGGSFGGGGSSGSW